MGKIWRKKSSKWQTNFSKLETGTSTPVLDVSSPMTVIIGCPLLFVRMNICFVSAVLKNLNGLDGAKSVNLRYLRNLLRSR